MISFNTLKADVTYTEEEKDDAVKVLAVGVGLVVYAAITQSKNKQRSICVCIKGGCYSLLWNGSSDWKFK